MGPTASVPAEGVTDPQQALDQWLAHCERLHPKEIDMTLARVAQVREALGLSFGETPVVMVAGTNGKGSTCAMLESVALQAGYRVGLYIKPHLVHFQERCRVDGRPWMPPRCCRISPPWMRRAATSR